MKKICKKDCPSLKDIVSFINENSIQKEDLVGIYEIKVTGNKYYSVLYYE